MTDNCKRVKRVIPTISGVVTFTDEWGNKSNFDVNPPRPSAEAL